MQQDNLEVLRAYFAAMERGDRERAMSYYHEDVVLEVPGRHAVSGRYEGLDGLKRFGAKMAEATGGIGRCVPRSDCLPRRC